MHVWSAAVWCGGSERRKGGGGWGVVKGREGERGEGISITVLALVHKCG